VASRCYLQLPVGSIVSDGTDVFLVADAVVTAVPLEGGEACIDAIDITSRAAVDSCCVFTSGLSGIEGAPKPDNSF
jgi:hypothetical protein